MAASRENLLSLGHLTGTERNTFTKQREQSLKKRPVLLQPDFLSPQSHHQLEVMHLQQRWQELKERELKAQQHNRLLLQQFDEAQDTLSEMITLTAAMKTIRKEYERYLEESSPRWQQQLKEKTQAAQRKRMEYLRPCLKNTEDHVTKSSADRPSLSQACPSTMPKEIAAPPKHYSPNSHLDYNQDGSPHLPYMQSSRQTYPQSQVARFPIRAPYQPQGSSHVPPSFLPPRIFPPPHHLASTPGHYHPSPRQNPPGWASLQPDYPWSWAAGAAGIPPGSEPLWGQLYMEEPPPETGVAQVAGEEADTSRAPSSKRERGGGDRSSHASQELDIKPVRLSDGHAESSESSQVSREKRKKRQERGRSQCSSSDRERCSSQKLSRTSSAIVAVTVAQSSESDDSSVKGRTSTSRGMRRSGGLAAESPRAEKVAKGSKGVDSGSHKEESQSTSEELQSLIEESRSEKVGNQSPDDKSENYREESASQREEQSGSVSIRTENGGGAEMEKQESSSSEQSSGREKDEEDLGDDGDAEEKENSQTDGEKAERNVENNDDASERKNKAEEEEETEEKDEESEEEGDHEENQSDRLKNEDGENRQQGSASSQDEEVDEDERKGGEDNMEEDGESDEEEEGAGEEEEEQRRDETGEAEKESDSEDSIISPQDKSKKMHTIAEEASEDDDNEEGGSSDDDSNEFSDEDDVEHLLAPQEQPQEKEEKDPRADEKPKAICDNVDIFQADKSTKSDHPSDSDEFDNFYG